MPSSGSKDLFALIKSLSKTEKGFFKVFAARRSKNDNLIYIQLFDVVEKQSQYDEKYILQNAKNISHSRLPNLKNYLYQLILQSLRELYADSSVANKIKVWLLDAESLYKKALYKQCAKTIIKVKKIAYQYEKYLQLLEALQWERRLVTAETYAKNLNEMLTGLIAEEKNILGKLNIISAYKDLSEKTFTILKTNSSSRNKKELGKYNKIFKNPLFKKSDTFLPNEARYYLYFTLANCYFGKGDKKNDYIFRKKIINLTDSHPEQIIENVDQYVGQINNLILSQLALKKYTEVLSTIERLKKLPAKSIFTQASIFSITCFYELSIYMETGEFDKGILLVSEVEKKMGLFSGKIHKAKEILINLACCSLYFGIGNYHKALFWLNKILNDTTLKLRQDLYGEARILNLIIHFELSNIGMLEYSVKSTQHFLHTRKRLYKFEYVLLDFLSKKLPKLINQQDQAKVFKELKQKLIELSKNPFEKQAFEYFDFISWVESKIENRSFAEIVREKARLHTDYRHVQ